MADDADLAAIRAFVASGGQFQTDKEGNIVAPIADPQATTPQATPAAPAADNAPDETPDEPGDKPADKPADKPKPQRPARKPISKGPLKGLMNWANNLPTPGGNLALVLILVFFAFAIIPVNSGRTRLQLIWDVLTGNAELPGSGTAGGVAGIDPAAAQAGAQAGIGAAISTATGGAFLPVAGALGLNYNLPGTSPAATATGAGPGQLDTSLSDPLTLLEAPRGNW